MLDVRFFFRKSQFVSRGLHTFNTFSTVSVKGDNVNDFLFALLHTIPLLELGLLCNERQEQILSLRSRSHFRRGQKQF